MVNRTELATLRVWAQGRIEKARKLSEKVNPLTMDGQASILRKQGVISELEFILTEDFHKEWEEVFSTYEETNGTRRSSR